MKRLFLAFAFAVALDSCALAQDESKAGTRQEENQGDKWILWKWANFAILAAGLGYLVAKNAGGFFRSRTEDIQKDIADATRIKQEADAKATEIERMVAGLDAEIERLRADAHAEMAAEGERISAETERRLARIQQQAEQEIASMTKLARHELRAYSASLALELAAHRVRQRIDADTQRRLVDGFVTELGDANRMRLTKS